MVLSDRSSIHCAAMANDVASVILEMLPTSAVWLVVYRDYNHEEGFCARKATNGFFFRHFGGDRHSVNTNLCDAKELYCATASGSAKQLWALASTMHRPRGLEIVYLPVKEGVRDVGSSEVVWRVGSAPVEKKDFLEQIASLLETLEDVRI